ncbi:hypothetical protein SNE40_006153 [Patella caerulea]|uniref:AIG1-type G domain-containing protein n=1 Tax=Patella caerulea TaxID=87958 RepID=A0AAN8K7D5_PATCE
MVLVGKTGAGKSSLGNSLLDKKVFESNTFGISSTNTCELGERHLQDGSKLVVVDTPGIFDTRNNITETSKEVVRCIGLSSPGPHAFVFVLKIGRFTQEEMDTIQHLKDLFGDAVVNHVIVVFTGEDSLDYEGSTIHQHIENSSEQLISLIHQCKGRVASINNRAQSINLQVDVAAILKLVRQTIDTNNRAHYTEEMFNKANEAMQSKIRQQEEEKMKAEQEILRREQALEERAKEIEAEMEKGRQLERENELRRQEIEQRKREQAAHVHRHHRRHRRHRQQCVLQ